MYKEFETRTSYRYLKEVIKSLNEPICILGGWAIFFHVNPKFQKEQQLPYLGSRDIDLGFHMNNKITKNSTIMQSIAILEKKLKFKPLNFRLYKEIHTETEEEVRPGQFIPPHFIFPMYIDLIVDIIPPDFKKITGFNPIDEPLLKFVFENHKTVTTAFNKKLFLPKPELIMAMKLKSLPNRGDKAHKKIKDLCDFFALAWYTDTKLDELYKNMSKYLSPKIINEAIKNITEQDLQQASAHVNHPVRDFKAIMENLKRK